MNRPTLIYCTSLLSDNQISILASVINIGISGVAQGPLKSSSLRPIENINLLRKGLFQIKVVGLDSEGGQLYIKKHDTDSFGKLEIKIPAQVGKRELCNILLYECSYYSDVDIHLGSIIPLKLDSPKRFIISDFDKTLIETRFSTLKDVYQSLKNPMTHWPAIEKSMELFKNYVERGHTAFVLSASPHFYASPIRNWLYRQEVYNATLLLKDYRNIFSFSAGNLSPRDIKKQGFYKLDQLVTLLLMTGVPEELVLMGDGIEADQDIYLILSAILHRKAEPWMIWNAVKQLKIFNFSSRQNSELLGKLYRLGDQIKHKQLPEVEVHIRCTKDIFERCKNAPTVLNNCSDLRRRFHYYIG